MSAAMSNLPSHQETPCMAAAHARRDVARAVRRVVSSVTTALADVHSGARSGEGSVSRSDALHVIEEALRESETLTIALRQLWTEHAGCVATAREHDTAPPQP